MLSIKTCKSARKPRQSTLRPVQPTFSAPFPTPKFLGWKQDRKSETSSSEKTRKPKREVITNGASVKSGSLPLYLGQFSVTSCTSTAIGPERTHVTKALIAAGTRRLYTTQQSFPPLSQGHGRFRWHQPDFMKPPVRISGRFHEHIGRI